MQYTPQPKPCSNKLEKIVKKADLNEIPMLIGWDVYVDVEGNVGFYEGNSCPMALPAYYDIFGGDLNNALVSIFRKKGVIGINADLSTETSLLVRQEAGFVLELLEKSDIPFVTSSCSNVAWDGKRLFFNESGRRIDFDLLFNRVPRGGRFIKEHVPDTSWLEAKVINPIIETILISNKLRTRRALEEMGIDSPMGIRVENEQQYTKASRRIMKHVRQYHPNYVAPFVLSKPVAGTGQKGIRIFMDDRSIDFSSIRYPCMVCERITSWPYENKDGIFAADIRMFSLGNYASHGIGKIAFEPISRFPGSFPRPKNYITKSYILELSREAEEAIQKYVLAASVAIHNFKDKYMRERKTKKNEQANRIF